MIRDPFGDPPLSRRIIGFITLTVGTDGDRSSIGNPSFPWPKLQRNTGARPLRNGGPGRAPGFPPGAAHSH